MVAAYRDPVELVAAAAGDRPDIVLIDLNDDAMEGLIAARELRERSDDLRIVLLVDYADPLIVRSALDHRVDA
ncbi:MAG: hypothetical protein QOI98_2560, partial [Solirubrobacteraceae bacterium]|nr:hypothetical protein [Solirubrobacteraceae bacterium]